jgi:succinate dehydrogenase flavin-adding protein (antitoxin of CptAB toxin-antitoxin module)
LRTSDDCLSYRIGRRFRKTDQQVRQFLEEEWAKLTVQDYEKYIKVMPQRVQAVIDAQGGHMTW